MKTLDFLYKQDIFDGLDSQQLMFIADISHEISVEANQYIIHEGKHSKYIYIIKKGEVRILKKDAENDTMHQIDTLSDGAILGEMSIIDNKTHSASVITTVDTILIALPINLLKNIKAKKTFISKLTGIFSKTIINNESDVIYNRIIINIAKKLVARLRSTNELATDALRSALAQEKARSAAGLLIINVVILMSLYTFALQFMTNLKGMLPSTTLLNIPFLIILALPLLIMMKASGYPIKIYGLTTKNWQGAVRESVIYTFPFLLALVIYKFILIHSLSFYANRPLFDMRLSLPTMHNLPVTTHFQLLILCGYLLFVPVQELLTRGAMQSSFQLLLTNKYKVVWAIILSNLLFSMMHIHVSLGLGFIVYLPGLFWGWLYSRHQTLIGVIVSHWMIGIWALFFVGIL